MKIVIIPAVSARLASVHDDLEHHEILGSWIDAGSCAEINDVAPGEGGLVEIVGSGLFEAAAASGMVVHGSPFGPPGPAPAGSSVDDIEVLETVSLSGCDPFMLSLHDRLAAGYAVSFVIVDESRQRRPLWVISGYRLPCLGPLPSCGFHDLWLTWFQIAGARTEPGHFLLDPRTRTATGAQDNLTARLRQLYGE